MRPNQSRFGSQHLPMTHFLIQFCLCVHDDMITTVRHVPIARMAPVGQTATRAGEEVERRAPSWVAGGMVKWGSRWAKAWQLPEKLKTRVTTLHSKVCTRERRKHAHTNTHLCMFGEALFVIAPKWKPPKRPSAYGRRTQGQHTHRRRRHSTLKGT